MSACRLGWLFIVLCSGLLASTSATAKAQLTILSQGDQQQKWRESQLETLAQQLQSADLNADLQAELLAQQRWLKSWKPGTLTENPMWSEAGSQKTTVEPVIDPQGRAAEVRERLLGEQARPTTRDTRALEKLLADYPDDVGVRQLHLHWLDQPQYRKTYPDQIAIAALRVVGLLEKLPDSAEVQLAKAHGLYRRGRALAYRQLPEVLEVMPLADPTAHEAELLGVYQQLKSLVGPAPRPEFVLLDVRMLRRDHWHGRALALLEDFGGLVSREWYLKKRADILSDLGWPGPASEAEKIYTAAFPPAQPGAKSL